MIEAKDIPQDVMWVWGIQSIDHPIGLDTLQEIKAIMKAYPKYFPWETKYDSIPQQVHDAYYEEKTADMRKLWEQTFKAPDGEGFIGLIPTIMKMAEATAPSMEPQPKRTLWQMFQDMAQQEEEKRKAERERFKKDKALWGKHYKSFGLEYRK